MLAAQVIKQVNGDYSMAALGTYRELLAGRLGKRDGKAIADFLPVWFKQSLAGVLLSTRWFVKNYVVERWFLHTQQPPLSPNKV